MDIDVAQIINALVPIAVAWYGYNQYTHNKKMDFKIEQYRRDVERKEDRRSLNSAKVFGELWKLLFALKADRVYVIQPHPLGHEAYVSIQFEVVRNGISEIKPHIQSLPMAECAVFCKVLVEELFVVYTDVGTQVNDKVVRSILSSNGSNVIAMKRLDGAHDWVGNIVVEFCDSVAVDQEQVRKMLHEAAINIQFTIPEYREIKLRSILE